MTQTSGSVTHRYMLIFMTATLALLFIFIQPIYAQAAPPAPQPANVSMPSAGNCATAIVNGDFEGTGGWIESSKSGASLISTFPPPSGAYHSGRQGAYLADYNNAHDVLAQQVQIPANTTQTQASFWWQVESSEGVSTARDIMTVTLDSPLGQPIVVLYTLDNRNQGATWQQAQVDLTPYLADLAGRTLYLRFEATTDANLLTAFYLDDVAFDICQATPTPTPTPHPGVTYFSFLPTLWK